MTTALIFHAPPVGECYIGETAFDTSTGRAYACMTTLTWQSTGDELSQIRHDFGLLRSEVHEADDRLNSIQKQFDSAAIGIGIFSVLALGLALKALWRKTSC